MTEPEDRAITRVPFKVVKTPPPTISWRVFSTAQQLTRKTLPDVVDVHLPPFSALERVAAGWATKT